MQENVLNVDLMQINVYLQQLRLFVIQDLIY